MSWVGAREVKVDLEGVMERNGGKYDQNTLYESLRELFFFKETSLGYIE